MGDEASITREDSDHQMTAHSIDRTIVTEIVSMKGVIERTVSKKTETTDMSPTNGSAVASKTLIDKRIELLMKEEVNGLTIDVIMGSIEEVTLTMKPAILLRPLKDIQKRMDLKRDQNLI